MSKPILCLDFDGVIHSYRSGWKGASVIPDPPVSGAVKFICDALEHFEVAVFSSRSNQPGGMTAMKTWLRDAFFDYWGAHPVHADDKFSEIQWPTEKPAAFVTIDYRALTFDGTWPSIEEIRGFKPWNKRPIGATGRHPQGMLDETDQGELKIGVAFDELDGVIKIDFGKPVAWIGWPPPEAAKFAMLLLSKCGVQYFIDGNKP